MELNLLLLPIFTETDVVRFATMPGDCNENHTSAEVAKKINLAVDGLRSLELAVSHRLLLRLA